MADDRKIAKENVVADIPERSRKITDAAGRFAGSVSAGAVYDRDGKRIAEFSATERAMVDGKNVKQRIYNSPTGSRYCLSGGVLRCDGTYYGSVPYNKDRRLVISLISLFILILVVAMILLITIGVPSPSLASPKEAPVINVSDADGQWRDGGEIAVFPARLQPGYSGSYGFVIHNSNDFDVSYSFYLQAVALIDGSDFFPVEFMLKMNNQHIGDTEDWLKLSELRFDDIDLLAGSSHKFSLEWRWPFEGGNDEYDTQLGKDGRAISIDIVLLATSA